MEPDVTDHQPSIQASIQHPRVFHDPRAITQPALAGQPAQRRLALLRRLGLGESPDEEFDTFARALAQAARDLTGAVERPYAMVNFISTRQYFAGLYAAAPNRPDSAVAAGAATGPYDGVQVGREMPLDYGWCPHVIDRGKALVLDDVCDYPRFVGNPVTARVGIRSYLGAPLIHHSGTTIGTICVVDRQPRPWGRDGLTLIKARATEIIDRIHDRERRLTGTSG